MCKFKDKMEVHKIVHMVYILRIWEFRIHGDMILYYQACFKKSHFFFKLKAFYFVLGYS